MFKQTSTGEWTPTAVHFPGDCDHENFSCSEVSKVKENISDFLLSILLTEMSTPVLVKELLKMKKNKNQNQTKLIKTYS